MLLERAGRLKRVLRTGWVRAGAARPESVADHSYRVALTAMAVGEARGLDVGRMTRMALLHDLPESEMGDPVPGEISEADKRRAEDAAWQSLSGAFPEVGDAAQAWAEYRAQSSEESRLVRQIDRLEMALEALELARKEGIDPTPFLTTARHEVTDPELRKLLDEEPRPSE
jgi:5'-deoxynucleotidase YfbR-like HD superfamily hydrolase